MEQMEHKMRNVLFGGGVSYGPDIKRLSDSFPVPDLTEGRVIDHGEIETAVGLKWSSRRYYAVVNAWMASKKSDNGIILVYVPSVGVKVLDPASVLGYAELKTKQKVKQLGRSMKTFAWVDRARLDSIGQQRLDHQLRIAAKLAGDLDEAKKGLAVELAPIRSMPRRITA